MSFGKLAILPATIRKLDTGTYTPPNKQTLGGWLDLWLAEYVQPSVKPLTYATYEARVRTRLKPALGNIKLTELNSTQIQAFLNDLTRKESLSPKTVKNTHGILHKALSQALDLKYIPFNPADSVKLPRIEQKEIQPLTEEEISAFLAEIEEGEPLARLFTVTLFTGMREGEICGLSWDAVNFADGTITVKQQLQKGKEKGSSHYIATTKSSKARTITAAPYVMNLLKEQRAAQHRERLALGLAWNNEMNLVFTYPDGSYIPMQTVLKRFKRIAAKIGRPFPRSAPHLRRDVPAGGRRCEDGATESRSRNGILHAGRVRSRLREDEAGERRPDGSLHPQGEGLKRI